MIASIPGRDAVSTAHRKRERAGGGGAGRQREGGRLGERRHRRGRRRRVEVEDPGAANAAGNFSFEQLEKRFFFRLQTM